LKILYYLFADAADRRRRRRRSQLVGAPPPPVKNTRRAAADSARPAQTTAGSVHRMPQFGVASVKSPRRVRGN